MQPEDPEKDSQQEAVQAHVSPTTTAFFIGFLIGIIVYSVAVNAWGISLLIPLWLLYLLLKKKG